MGLLSHLLGRSSSKSSSSAASVSNPGVSYSPPSFTRKRLQKELEKITRDPPSHCSGGLVRNDIFKWQGAILGPVDTPFEGGVFFLSVCFPRDYPHKPPKIKFLTKVYHPNIDAKGNIHVDILKECWTPALTIDKVLLSLCSLLTDPNASGFLNSIAGLYSNERTLYTEKARAWTKKYAMG
ncbi:ubiquitin-conjugating enzyme E2 11-like [Macadamia integrifolia]|uniref:ubiquitin-conjugating enzyme E2 11-like n=1 Tax=Macadamia integrifolia TaxID=60698 RepID=UPI001C50145B|nr:ubiquitin-conjugating enzyme E2 11-like [Macadamia integrifolia]